MALATAGLLSLLVMSSGTKEHAALVGSSMEGGATHIASETLSQQRPLHLLLDQQHHQKHPTTALPLPSNSIYRLSAVDIDGKVVSLAKYAGHPAIVVNVASF